MELDVLTGEITIRRVDILEDTGTSINPEVDVGQLEGAFVMSLGMWLTEQVRYDPDSGRLLTHDTWVSRYYLLNDLYIKRTIFEDPFQSMTSKKKIEKNRPNLFIFSQKFIAKQNTLHIIFPLRNTSLLRVRIFLKISE